MAERKPTKQTNGKNNFWIRLFVLLEVRGCNRLAFEHWEGKEGGRCYQILLHACTVGYFTSKLK